MWSTVIRCSQAAASLSDQQCSLSVIKATSCLATACSPATTEIQLHPSGVRGYRSVSVSSFENSIIIDTGILNTQFKYASVVSILLIAINDFG